MEQKNKVSFKQESDDSIEIFCDNTITYGHLYDYLIKMVNHTADLINKSKPAMPEAEKSIEDPAPGVKENKKPAKKAVGRPRKLKR